MSRRRDPLRLSSHWHVDCRIETDLPEDSLIGANFITNVTFSAFALVVILFFSWTAYRTLTLRKQIGVWEQRIAESFKEVREIQRMQREYVAEAAKIDRAYAEIRPRLFVSEFLVEITQSLPPQITVDSVDCNDAGIIVRGSLREPMSSAPATIGTYREILWKNKKLNERFQLINVSALARGKNEEYQNFEIKFSLNPLPPL